MKEKINTLFVKHKNKLIKLSRPGFILAFFFVYALEAYSSEYPSEWFKEVPRSEAQDWEILPQDAKSHEVILSKRTELGIFSNFAATPITFEGIKFSSIEGLWQSLKYPDLTLENDLRRKILGWPLTREEVQKLVGFEAKTAGNLANKIYKENDLKEINWGNHFFDYNDLGSGSAYHYSLIKRVLRAKLDQTEGLWDLLLKTKCLILLSDHKMGENLPPSYYYNKIFMELRSEKLAAPCGQVRKKSRVKKK